MISSELNLGLKEGLKGNIKWMFLRIWILHIKIQIFSRTFSNFSRFLVRIQRISNKLGFKIFIFRFRVNLQQQFRAKISKISELEKHSHESITEETEKEDQMLPNILRDTESYHLVIGKAFENLNRRPRLTVRCNQSAISTLTDLSMIEDNSDIFKAWKVLYY